jgi:hypothetical protein
MGYGENGTVTFFETLTDDVFRHNYSMMQIKTKMNNGKISRLPRPTDIHIYFWLKENILTLMHLRVLLLNIYEISSIYEYPVWR